MPAGPVSTPEWFGQPRGLTVLFLTEMWEVFSFVGMRTMLIYYMVSDLRFAQRDASLTYGLYTGFVYLTPILGGLVADRILGRRRAVIAGGAIMALGHFLMIFPELFYPALATVAVGNGLFLPSLPSQIPALYAPGDPRRNAAYSVYYMGKNAGALLAPLVCGFLGETYGWHWGFGAAGVGMLIGLAFYIGGRRHLPADEVGRAAEPAALKTAPRHDLTGRLVLLLAVALGVVAFRAAYEQVGNTVALWIGAHVYRQATASLTIPKTWFQSLNPLFVFTGTPLLIVAWTRLARRGREPDPLTKMATGGLLLAAAYGVLSMLATTSGGASVQWFWLPLFFVLLTAGELHTLPIGLALFGRLAPPAAAATIIACWYLTSFGGNLLAGFIGTFWSRTDPGTFFGAIAMLAAASAGMLALLQRPARRLEEGPIPPKVTDVTPEVSTS